MTPTAEQQTFEATLSAHDKVAVMFTATWCGPCRTFKPHFNAADTGEWEKVIVDISDEANPLWEEHHVMAVPTVVFFDGGEEVHRISGFLRPNDLARALDVVSA